MICLNVHLRCETAQFRECNYEINVILGIRNQAGVWLSVMKIFLLICSFMRLILNITNEL